WIVHAARAIFGEVPGVLAVYVAVAATVLIALAFRAAREPSRSPKRITRDCAVLILATLFFLSPNYPWYYLLAAALIPIGAGAPAWAFSLCAPLLYLLYPDYDARFLIWKGVIVGVFLIAMLATVTAVRLKTNPAALRWMR